VNFSRSISPAEQTAREKRTRTCSICLSTGPCTGKQRRVVGNALNAGIQRRSSKHGGR
jgi:hypothetical protein